jgi:hypothetical protein
MRFVPLPGCRVARGPLICQKVQLSALICRHTLLYFLYSIAFVGLQSIIWATVRGGSSQVLDLFGPCPRRTRQINVVRHTCVSLAQVDLLLLELAEKMKYESERRLSINGWYSFQNFRNLSLFARDSIKGPRFMPSSSHRRISSKSSHMKNSFTPQRRSCWR